MSKEYTPAQHEIRVAETINQLLKEGISPNAYAERSNKGVRYSDIEIYYPKNPREEKPSGKTWCEVKMNHTDNLANVRVMYKNGKWQLSGKSQNVEAANIVCEELNDSNKTRDWVNELADFCLIKRKEIWLPTEISLIKKAGINGYENIVSLEKMRLFLKTKTNQYIFTKQNYDLGKLATIHYTIGKNEPVHYIQSGDGFYLLGDENPLGLKGVPKFGGTGNLSVRISLRNSTQVYEIQPELKIRKNTMEPSPYSCTPNTVKKNPFLNK